jgi:ribonucleoside-diphosphate reductase alpha chain
MYSRDEVYSETIKYFNQDVLASEVWMNKYALRNKEGQFLENSPLMMHQRLAREFARIELKYPNPISEESILSFFTDWSIIPQGSVMYGAGNDFTVVSLSNCTVLGVDTDSYAGILDLDQQVVQSAKRRMGYGLDISFLRPKGSTVNNAAQTSTGAVSFMERFSNSTRECAQEGRRGACLISLDVRHPDIYDFVTVKNDRTKITGANISIKIRDDFIHAVQHDTDYVLRYPSDYNFYEHDMNDEGDKIRIAPYNVLEPTSFGYIKRIRAKELWDLIIKNAREHSEPGLFLWDRMVDYDPASVYPSLKPVSTNACGEIPQAVGDTCRLIVLNLLKCVDRPFTAQATFNFQRLEQLAGLQLRLGDDLVDLEIEAVDKIINKIINDPGPDYLKDCELRLWKRIKEQAINGRRCGCGLTGLGDMFAALGLPYGSLAALELTEKIMYIKMRVELDTSITLAKERGPFEFFNFELEFDDNLQGRNSFYEMIRKEYPWLIKHLQMHGRRNVNWSCVAPTGSVSILTGTTSGIEPLFKPYYVRRRKIEHEHEDFIDQNGDKWQEYFVLHPQFKKWIIQTYDYLHTYELNNLTEKNLEYLYVFSPWHKSCAEEISSYNRIRIQSMVQHYTTSAISSTLNLPENVSEQQVADIYLQSWALGLKGVTIYRANSRTGVLVDIHKKQKSVAFEKRPEILPGKLSTFWNEGKKWLGVIGLKNDQPYELFAGEFPESMPIDVHKPSIIVKIKEANRHNQYWLSYSSDIEQRSLLLNNLGENIYGNYARLISGLLRHQMPTNYVISVLEKLRLDGDSIHTWRNGVIRLLKDFVTDGVSAGSLCKECGGQMVYQEGCKRCTQCLTSLCG